MAASGLSSIGSQASREQGFARDNQKYVNQQNKLSQTKKDDGPDAEAKALANAAILQAYTRGWQYAQEAVEDFAFTFTDFMLVSGPAVILIFLVRMIVGNWMNGGPQISYHGISVPMVPPMGWVEATFRTAKFLFVAVVIFYYNIAGGILLFFVTNPKEVLTFGGQAVFGLITAIIKWLGLGNAVGLITSQ